MSTLSSSSSLCLSTFNLYTSTYSSTTTTNVKNMFSSTLVSKSKTWKCTCTKHAQKIVIETLMVGHFGAHNKGQKPCANEQFILPSSFYPYSFSLYTSTYSTANYYKCERTCPIQPSVETYILQSTCVEQAHKFVVELSWLSTLEFITKGICHFQN